MKTTVEIADALFQEARSVMRKRGLTFRAFLEESIRKNLATSSRKRFRLRRHPFGGEKRHAEPDWRVVRAEIYRGRGE